MTMNLVIGAVASASACVGMVIGHLITKAHYRKYVPKWGTDGKFAKRS